MHSTNQPPPGNSRAHASAAGIYSRHAQTTTTDPRELEARALLNMVSKMESLQSRWDTVSNLELDDVLRNNRQIWMMFVDTALEDKSAERTDQLRSNIANLGAYVFKRTLEILTDPKKEKLDVLIDINRDIAAGLMTRPKSG
jgi:flagellar protein FlaF